MMDAVTDPAVETVTIMKSARTGGTEVLNNFIGYAISEDPGPILMVRPTDRQAKKWSKINFDSMVRDTPILRDKVFTLEQRSKRNEILMKQFVGGLLYIVGANSPVGLSDSTIRYLLGDEVDRFPVSVGGEEGEGDPIKLAEKRTLTYWNRKIIWNSTPTTKGLSRIEDSWNASDQRLFYVPCTRCGTMQVLVFSRQSQILQLLQANQRPGDALGEVRYDKHNLTWATFQCGSCGRQLDESQKHKMLAAGEWRALHPERKTHAGFHISELYSPWSTWLRIARDFVECERRREKLRVFINLTLGETFEENRTTRVDEHEMLRRREGYTKVPAGIVFLVASIDTQDDRFEVLIKGWGLNEESWFIDKIVVSGSPAHETTLKMLDAVVFRPYEHANGYTAQPGQLGGVIAVGIDTGGHHTKAVYDYVAKRKGRRVFALKGVQGFGKQFLVKRSSNRKVQVPLQLVGTDAAKETIHDRLAIEIPADSKAPIPGALHFNEKCDIDYFEQLMSERRVIVRTRGIPKLVWKKIDENRPNEALDLEVYNLATYAILQSPMARLKEKLEKMMARQAKEGKPPEEEKPGETKRSAKSERRPRRGGFIDNW